MTLIADILLTAGCIGAALYCYILGRRLRAFNDLEKGMGGAVAVLSAQVDDLEKSVATAKASASMSQLELQEVTRRAEDVRRQLEIQIAAMHDIKFEDPPAQHAIELEEQESEKHIQFSKPVSEPMFTRHRSAERAQ